MENMAAEAETGLGAGGLEGDSNVGGAPDVAAYVRDNLRRLRKRQGLSLERLAKASGVSRAMLGQIEQGRSSPTIAVLWKIAHALQAPLSAFTAPPERCAVRVERAHRARRVTSGSGRYTARPLFVAAPLVGEGFYEIRLAPQSVEEEAPHPPGATETVVVSRGVLDVGVGGEWRRLECGDAIWFAADVPHAYRNPGEVEAVAYLVVSLRAS